MKYECSPIGGNLTKILKKIKFRLHLAKKSFPVKGVLHDKYGNSNGCSEVAVHKFRSLDGRNTQV